MTINDDLLKLLFLAHVGATLLMVGVIWTIQIVHYPLFSAVGADGFATYQIEHSRRISYVVVPLMLFELATAALFVIAPPVSAAPPLLWAGLALVLLIWLSTFALQVPQHTVLSGGFDARAHRLLVGTNWLRTVAWSLRGLLVLWLAARAIG